MNSISKSQINSYTRCPFAYYCRYVLGKKIPPMASLTLGKCFDHAINVDYTAKKQSGKDEPISVITDAFVTLFDEEKHNTVFLEDEKPDELKDKTIPAIKLFHSTICPQVEPAEVQLESSIQFQNVDYSLKVVVDCIDKKGVIIDNKLTKRSFTDVDSMFDAPVYSLWYFCKYGVLPAGFAYDVAITTKQPQATRVMVEVTNDIVESALKKVALVKDSIDHDDKRGAFFPNTRNFLCSRRHCGYWELCEKEYKHKIKP